MKENEQGRKKRKKKENVLKKVFKWFLSKKEELKKDKLKEKRKIDGIKKKVKREVKQRRKM